MNKSKVNLLATPGMYLDEDNDDENELKKNM